MQKQPPCNRAAAVSLIKAGTLAGLFFPKRNPGSTFGALSAQSLAPAIDSDTDVARDTIIFAVQGSRVGAFALLHDPSRLIEYAIGMSASDPHDICPAGTLLVLDVAAESLNLSGLQFDCSAPFPGAVNRSRCRAYRPCGHAHHQS